MTSAHGSSGRLEFDNNGDMIAAEYTIVNVQGNAQEKHLVNVGSWFAMAREPLSMKTRILWPGGTYTKPEGFELPMHLRVSIPLLHITNVDKGDMWYLLGLWSVVVEIVVIKITHNQGQKSLGHFSFF